LPFHNPTGLKRGRALLRAYIHKNLSQLERFSKNSPDLTGSSLASLAPVELYSTSYV